MCIIYTTKNYIDCFNVLCLKLTYQSFHWDLDKNILNKIEIFDREFLNICNDFCLENTMDTFMDTMDTKYGRFLGMKKGFTVAVNPCF
jgi:hypothetical protein